MALIRNKRQEALPASHRQAGDETARLYGEFAGPLARYARSVAADEFLATDAVQEAFLRYFTLRCDGRNIENPRSWLITVLRNYILDAKRRRRWEEAQGVGQAAESADPSEDPRQSFLRQQIAGKLARGLTRRERDCLELRLAGWKQAEIARALGLKNGTVGALLSRASRKLRGAVQAPGTSSSF